MSQSNKIPYQFLSLIDEIPATGYWDHTLITDIFNYDDRFEEIDSTHEVDGSIVVLPAPYHNQKIDEVNAYLSQYEWVILIVTSDESSIFRIEDIKHSNIQIYMMYPKIGRHDEYKKMPLGYSKDYRKYVSFEDKDLDFFFSGQITNHRRSMFFSMLKSVNWDSLRINGKFEGTDGFAKGMKKEEYAKYMNLSKLAPCPPGPMTSDSFRVYEALESGAIPIADGWGGEDKDFFTYLLKRPEFSLIKDYESFPGYVVDQISQFPKLNNRAQSWWIKYKQDMKNEIIKDAERLSNKEFKQKITVIVPISPIKSHPSTNKLEMCINSMRHHLKSKNVHIILTFDGVRQEQEHMRSSYEEFIRKALFLSNSKWGNVTPLIFENHTHQVGMLREALKIVETPTVLYVESDTGFVLDREIDFDKCYENITSGNSNLIRFHHEGVIPQEHNHLMLGVLPGLIQTVQWSQRPHIASTAYYKRIIDSYFSEDAKSFIEDKMHGIVQNDYNDDGMNGWYQHRIHIYSPEPNNLKYSVDFNGREGEEKYDESQVF